MLAESSGGSRLLWWFDAIIKGPVLGILSVPITFHVEKKRSVILCKNLQTGYINGILLISELWIQFDLCSNHLCLSTLRLMLFLMAHATWWNQVCLCV